MVIYCRIITDRVRFIQYNSTHLSVFMYEVRFIQYNSTHLSVFMYEGSSIRAPIMCRPCMASTRKFIG